MILLSKPPRGTTKLSYLSNSIDHQPTHGGATKRINRLGDRFSFEVSIRARGDQGSALVARLNAGRSDKVRIPIHQAVEYARVTGPVRVSTSISGGQSLNLNGLPAGHKLMGGQLISIKAVSGVSYLHQIVNDATANASGVITLTVAPMIRTVLSVGDLVEVNDPVIEGYLAGSATEWTVDFMRSVQVGFTIVEAE